MRIALEKPKPSKSVDGNGWCATWKDSEPFVVNRRGLLIHRPRSVSLYNSLNYPHIAVHYYCGGSACDSDGKLSFVADVNEDQLLCKICEVRAVMCGLPSASDITGHHVHVGKLKAIKLCCKN